MSWKIDPSNPEVRKNAPYHVARFNGRDCCTYIAYINGKEEIGRFNDSVSAMAYCDTHKQQTEAVIDD